MKYITVYNDLLSKISQGTYLPDTCIPHTHALIKQYKVSLTTIVKAVKMLEKGGHVRRIKSKGTFVLAEGTRRLLAAKSADKVGLIFRGYLSEMMSAHFFVQAFQGMEEACRDHRKSLVVLAMEDKRPEQYVSEILSSGVSGVISFSMHLDEIFQGLRRQKIPMVYCDYMDYHLPVDQVTMDHVKAGGIALKQLYDLGHRRTVFLGNYHKRARMNDRDHDFWRLGAEAEARLLRVKPPHAYFIPFEGGPETMRRQIKKAVEKHADCTGYLCASTTYYEQLKKIIEGNPGFDRTERDAVLFSDWPVEKTLNGRKVHQCRWDTREMGRRSAEIVISIMNGGPYKPQIHYLPVEIR